MTDHFQKYAGKEVNINGKNFTIAKLMTEHSYTLYTETLSIIGGVEGGISGAISAIAKALPYSRAVYYISSAVTMDGKSLNRTMIDELGPLYVIELLGHIIKYNIIDSLGKHDFVAMIIRLFPGFKDIIEETATKFKLPSTSQSSMSPTSIN